MKNEKAHLEPIEGDHCKTIIARFIFGHCKMENGSERAEGVGI